MKRIGKRAVAALFTAFLKFKGRYIMDRQNVIDNIIVNYGQYGIDINTIEELINSGEAKGWSYSVIYTGLRLALSSVFGTKEYFFMDEISEALGMTPEEVENMRNEVSAAGFNPDEFVFPLNNENKRVLLPSNYLKEG